ncbi:MAG: hypothetical protein WBV94_11110 [Blastocatellia bacterium]
MLCRKGPNATFSGRALRYNRWLDGVTVPTRGRFVADRYPCSASSDGPWRTISQRSFRSMWTASLVDLTPHYAVRR